MIDLDLLDEQLEQALTDDVRALRGGPAAQQWSDRPPTTHLPPATPPELAAEDAPGFDAWDDDEWTARGAAGTPDPAVRPAPAEAPGPSPMAPDGPVVPSPSERRASGASASARTPKAPPTKKRAGAPARTSASARTPARLDVVAPSTPPAPDRAGAAGRRRAGHEPEPEPDELLTAEEVFAPPAAREPGEPARRRPPTNRPSRPRPPFAAGAAFGWEKTEAERSAATAKRPRRPADRPGLPIHARAGQPNAAGARTTETPPAPDSRHAARARLREAVAELAAKDAAAAEPAAGPVEPQHAAQWAAMSEQFKPRTEPPARLSIWRGR